MTKQYILKAGSSRALILECSDRPMSEVRELVEAGLIPVMAVIKAVVYRADRAKRCFRKITRASLARIFNLANNEEYEMSLMHLSSGAIVLYIYKKSEGRFLSCIDMNV